MSGVLKSPFHTGDPLTYGLLSALPARLAALPELAQVRLSRAVDSDAGGEVPAGSQGTIVGVWGAGQAYEVEFVSPFGALATVPAGAVEVVMLPGD